MARRRASFCLALLLSTPLFLNAAERPAVLPNTLAQRLAACTSCHARTDTAHGTEYFPRIAGKPAGYLYNQLINFRDGRRQYPVMAYMVAYLPEPYLHEIAGYFAALPPSIHPAAGASAPPDAALLERGRVLATQGDAARKSACRAITSIPSSAPGATARAKPHRPTAWRRLPRA
jgi:cytochrome c553